MNRDHSVVFETASKYCILGSFVDSDGRKESDMLSRSTEWLSLWEAEYTKGSQASEWPWVCVLDHLPASKAGSMGERAVVLLTLAVTGKKESWLQTEPLWRPNPSRGFLGEGCPWGWAPAWPSVARPWEHGWGLECCGKCPDCRVKSRATSWLHNRFQPSLFSLWNRGIGMLLKQYHVSESLGNSLRRRVWFSGSGMGPRTAFLTSSQETALLQDNTLSSKELAYSVLVNSTSGSSWLTHQGLLIWFQKAGD